MILGINHIGVCVKSIDDFVAVMENAFGAKVIERVSMPDRNQTSCVVEFGTDGSRYEVMEPIGEEGVVWDYLQKKGQGLHHISLNVEDIEKDCAELEAKGIRIIGKTKGLAFTHPKTTGGILYELTDGTFND
ncbi:MAG: hypothetical protein E7442_02835 [Ruminococcaceae bacterium]|nr:hypothetical protein [Oscillospiraceae bacterium]